MDWKQVAGAPSGAPQLHFGDLQQELQAARSSAIVSPLGHFDLLRFSGAEALPFLQNQLTCDLRQITPANARYGGYCTPKGRLLADFLLLLMPQGYLMHLPAELSTAIADRLRKFVLRSQVRIESEQELRAIGIGGPEAAGLLRQSLGESPRMPLEVVHYPAASLLRLPVDGFLAIAPNAQIAALWSALAKQAVPAGSAAWDWLQVRAGVPWITAATQDQFVPQMVDLDALGGVSFDKGCYPGQEIVARTHYLGEVKRRLHAGHADDIARIGDPLVVTGQTRAVVLNAAPAPDGGSDLLAVVQSAAGVDEFRLRDAHGARVELTALPG